MVPLKPWDIEWLETGDQVVYTAGAPQALGHRVAGKRGPARLYILLVPLKPWDIEWLETGDQVVYTAGAPQALGHRVAGNRGPGCWCPSSPGTWSGWKQGTRLYILLVPLKPWDIEWLETGDQVVYTAGAPQALGHRVARNRGPGCIYCWCPSSPGT